VQADRSELESKGKTAQHPAAHPGEGQVFVYSASAIYFQPLAAFHVTCQKRQWNTPNCKQIRQGCDVRTALGLTGLGTDGDGAGQGV